MLFLMDRVAVTSAKDFIENALTRVVDGLTSNVDAQIVSLVIIDNGEPI